MAIEETKSNSMEKKKETNPRKAGKGEKENKE